MTSICFLCFLVRCVMVSILPLIFLILDYHNACFLDKEGVGCSINCTTKVVLEELGSLPFKVFCEN